MDILILLPVLAVGVTAAIAIAACRMHRRSGPATWGSPEAGQHGHHVGERCPCGGGILQVAWQHGRGDVLGCTRYPECRVAFEVSGRALPPGAAGAELTVRAR
jgi:hypothetical protein